MGGGKKQPPDDGSGAADEGNGNGAGKGTPRAGDAPKTRPKRDKTPRQTADTVEPPPQGGTDRPNRRKSRKTTIPSAKVPKRTRGEASIQREVFFARNSFAHDGVEVPGRLGAFLGVLALMCFVPAFMLDDMVVITDVREHITGLNGRTNIHLGGWQHCWEVPIDRFQCEIKKVCFAYDEEVRTSGVECILVGGSAVDGPGDSGSGSGSGDFGGNSSEDFELGSLAPNTTLAEDGKSGTVCKILGAGYAWCDFLRYAVQFCNCFAIMAGVAGDVLSDKVHSTQFFNRWMGHFSALSVILMWFAPWIIYRPNTASMAMPGISCYFVMGGCVLAYLGAYMAKIDIAYYPNTRRFGIHNDGLGLCQRMGALTGAMSWAALGMAVCSHRWSETDMLGRDPDDNDSAPSALHFAALNLGMVEKASWGLVRYCVEIPIAALSGSLGSVCLTYSEEFIAIDALNETAITSSGCDAFKNQPDYDVCTTIEVVLTLALACIAVGVIGDTFSEKITLNIIAFGLVFCGAAAVAGVWMSFNAAISGPTEYGAASQVFFGAGFYLCVGSSVLGFSSAVAYFMDYRQYCWKWVERKIDDEEDDDLRDDLPGRLFDCCECIEYTCYGDDLGPATELLVKHTHVAYAMEEVHEAEDRPSGLTVVLDDGDAVERGNTSL